MGWLDAIVNAGVNSIAGSVANKTSGQRAYESARNAGASTGRARQAAQRSLSGQLNPYGNYSGFEAQRLISNPGARQTATNDQIDTALGILQSRGVQDSDPQAYKDFEGWANDKKAKNEEERLYKGRNKNPFHHGLDETLGKEGLGGLANELIGYSPVGIVADTFMPEFAFNPETQENAAKKTYEGGGPVDFTGDFSMPSAEQMQVLQGDDLARWQHDAGDLAEKDIMALTMFNPGGQEIAAAGKVGGPTIKDLGKGFADVAKESLGSQTEKQAGKKGGQKLGLWASNLEDKAAQEQAMKEFYERYTPEQLAWMRGEGELESNLARNTRLMDLASKEATKRGEQEDARIAKLGFDSRKKAEDDLAYNTRMMDAASKEATKRGEQEDIRRAKALGDSKRAAEDDLAYRTNMMDMASREATRQADLPAGKKMTVSKFRDMIRRIFGQPTSGLTSGSRIAPDGTMIMDDAAAEMFGSQVPRNVMPDGTIIMEDADSIFANAARNVGAPTRKWDPTQFRTADSIRAENAAKRAAKNAGNAAPQSADDAAMAAAEQEANRVRQNVASMEDELYARAAKANDRKQSMRSAATRGERLLPENTESVMENAVDNVTGGSFRDAIRNRNGGRRTLKAKDPGTKIDKIYADESKLQTTVMAKEKALNALDEGTPEWDKAVKELEKAEGELSKFQEKNAADKVKYANEDKSGYAYETVLDNTLRRAEDRNLNELHDTNWAKGRMEGIQNTSTGRGLGPKMPEDVAALYDDATLDKMNSLSDKGLEFLKNSIDWNNAPNQATMDRLVDRAVKMERNAGKYDARRVAGAAGGLTGLAGTLGTWQGFQTADAFDGRPAGFVPTSNVGSGENGGTTAPQAPSPNSNGPDVFDLVGDNLDAAAREAGLDIDTDDLIWGLSRDDWYKKEQRDQYQQAMQQEAMRNWLGSLDKAYLDPEWGYENFRNSDFGHKEEMVRNFLGYGDKALELPEWREMYNNAIVKWTDGAEHLTGDADHDIPLVMDYMFGAGAIDPNMATYIGEGGQQYRAGHTLGYGDASSELMSRYLLNNDTDLSQLTDANGNRLLPEGIDNDDVALLLWLEDMQNREDQGIYSKYGQDNLDQISALLAPSGDVNTAFEFYEPEEGEKEFEWHPREGLNYSSFMNALSANPAALEQFYPIYDQAGVEGAVGADFADTLMADLQERSGKKIRRKSKDGK